MATRFYFTQTASNLAPFVDAGWDDITSINYSKLLLKNGLSVLANASSGARSIPVTTTQNICFFQFGTEPLRAQKIEGTLSLAVKGIQSVSTANASLAISIYLTDTTGNILYEALYENYDIGNDFATGTATTRTLDQVAITPATCRDGDRIIVEIGVHVQAPSTTGTATVSMPCNTSPDWDTTPANPGTGNGWIEFSADLFSSVPNNFKGLKAGNGMSIGEKIR